MTEAYLITLLDTAKQRGKTIVAMDFKLTTYMLKTLRIFQDFNWEHDLKDRVNSILKNPYSVTVPGWATFVLRYSNYINHWKSVRENTTIASPNDYYSVTKTGYQLPSRLDHLASKLKQGMPRKALDLWTQKINDEIEEIQKLVGSNILPEPKLHPNKRVSEEAADDDVVSGDDEEI